MSLRNYLTSLRAEVWRLWLVRRHNLRFWLLLFVAAWGGAALLGFPHFPVWRFVNMVPEPVWALWALACVLLLLGPPRYRLWGATLAACMYLLAVVCFTAATGFRPQSATLTYGLLMLLAAQVASDGAE